MPFRVTSFPTTLAFRNTLRGHTHTVAHSCLFFIILATQVWILLGLLLYEYVLAVCQMNLHIFSGRHSSQICFFLKDFTENRSPSVCISLRPVLVRVSLVRKYLV